MGHSEDWHACRTATVRHLPGQPFKGVQSCERCALVLAVDLDATPAGEDPLILFFRPFVEVVQNGAYTGLATAAHADVPSCDQSRVPVMGFDKRPGRRPG